MVVGAAAGEAHQAVGAGPVGVGQVLQVGGHVGLGAPVGHGQSPGDLQSGRHGGEELVEVTEPEEGQHGRDLVVGVGEIVAHRVPARPAGALGRGQKGVGTTVAPSSRPRTATVTTVPSSRPAAVSTRAKAMPRSSIGEKLPLVTVPTTAPRR